MIDYLTIRSDPSYSKSIGVAEASCLLSGVSRLRKVTGIGYQVTLGRHVIRVQGVCADSNGNYSFDSDAGFREINMVEINLPLGSESECEEEIRVLAFEIARVLNWEIVDHETGEILGRAQPPENESSGRG